MAKKEKQQEKQLFNIEELVNNMAQDIAKFSEDVAKARITRDLKSLDLSAAAPEAGAAKLKGVLSQLKSEGDKVSRQHQEQIQIQSEALEESIKSRQENLKSNLRKLKETDTEAKSAGSFKIAEMRIEENIKSYDRHIEELHIAKTGSHENIWTEANILKEIKTPAGEKISERKVSRNIKL